MVGPFDGASRFDRNLALWTPSLQSADDDITPVKRTVDARVRDTLRNDAYVVNAQRLRQDSIVGSVFFLNSKPASAVLGDGFDEVWEEEFQEEVESKFTVWAESPQKWVDASRHGTLTDLVRLAVATELAAGEVLASVEWLRDSGRPFHTAIQMIDTDRLSTPPLHSHDRFIRDGVRRNKFGAPVSYFIQRAHPSDWRNPDMALWKEVKARKPWGRVQIIHFYEQHRADQTRGLSALVSALKELRISKKFRDVVLQNAIVQATFAATIESEFKEQVLSDFGFEKPEDFDASYLGGLASYFNHSGNLKIDGVKIPVMYPGTKLQIRGAGQGGPLGTEFEQSLLRYFAASTGVSYEEISRDYSSTNYSSIRAAMTSTWQSMQARKMMVADRFATHVFWCWLEEALNAGAIESLPRPAKDSTFFYSDDHLNLMFEALGQCDWIGASRGQIDELKETQAAVLRIKNNLSTYEKEIARLGGDWRKQLRQRKREQELLEEMNLLPPEKDNQMNAVSGSERTRDPGDPETDPEENTETGDE